MNKLLIVSNEINAKQLRPVLTDVDVISLCESRNLCGKGYDVIMLVGQTVSGSEAEKAKWQEHLSYLKRRLFPNGVLIEVY